MAGGSSRSRLGELLTLEIIGVTAIILLTVIVLLCIVITLYTVMMVEIILVIVITVIVLLRCWLEGAWLSPSLHSTAPSLQTCGLLAGKQGTAIPE